MKQVYATTALVMILAASACTPQGATNQTPEQQERSEATGAAEGQSLEGTLPAKELEALQASARTLVGEFVDAFSSGNSAAAETKLIPKTAFDEIVAPGFRDILGSGLLAKNHEELANLIEALAGHKVESWNWKPGKLVKTESGAAFSRSLVQMTGGTIELVVDGSYIAVGIDQLVRLDDNWVIFQIHNL